MEAQRLGDMAVTEGWAMLMQHLVTEPAWLNRRLDVPRVDELAHDGAVSLLYFVRRYCGEAALRDRVLPGGRPDADARAATPRSSATR